MTDLEELKQGLASGDVTAKKYLRNLKLMRARGEVDERDYLDARDFYMDFIRKPDAKIKREEPGTTSVSLSGLGNVKVTDVKIPFISLVVLMIKIAIAAIPAAMIVAFLYMFLAAVLFI